MDVSKVITNEELARELKLSSAYTTRLAKGLLSSGLLTPDDIRQIHWEIIM